MSSMEKSRDRESRHLWVGGLPDDVGEGSIKDFFARYVKCKLVTMQKDCVKSYYFCYHDLCNG